MGCNSWGMFTICSLLRLNQVFAFLEDTLILSLTEEIEDIKDNKDKLSPEIVPPVSGTTTNQLSK
jgi:hypothetical protein